MAPVNGAHQQQDALTLRTPGPSPPERPLAHASAREGAAKEPDTSSAKDEDALLTVASRAFSFPYPQAYKIQIDLMREVFRCVEDKKIGIFESPTGTVRELYL